MKPAPVQTIYDAWGTAPGSPLHESAAEDRPSREFPLSSFDPQPPIEVLDYDDMMAEILRLEVRIQQLKMDAGAPMNFFSSIRRWAFGVGRSAFSFSAHFLVIVAIQFALCVALVLSLSWNIRQARERSAAVEQSYLAGVDDGEAMLRARIARRIIELQLIEESQATARREKL